MSGIEVQEFDEAGIDLNKFGDMRGYLRDDIFNSDSYSDGRREGKGDSAFKEHTKEEIIACYELLERIARNKYNQSN